MERVQKMFYHHSQLAISETSVMDCLSLLDRKDLIRILKEKDRQIAQLELKLAQLPDSSKEFISRLKKGYPGLSSNDLRICSLLRLNFSTKEIAQNLSIGAESANKARYRIRKKLRLGKNDDLVQFILEF